MHDEEDENLAGEVEPEVVVAPMTTRAIGAIAAQRTEDDGRLGFFRDYPDGVAGAMFAGPSLPADLREVQHAKQALADAKRVANPSWRHLMALEVAHVNAARDEAQLRAALVRTGAVAVAWLEALERRAQDRKAEVVHLTWWQRLTASIRRMMVRA